MNILLNIIIYVKIKIKQSRLNRYIISAYNSLEKVDLYTDMFRCNYNIVKAVKTSNKQTHIHYTEAKY